LDRSRIEEHETGSHTHWNRHVDNRVTAPLLAHDCFGYNEPNRHALEMTHSLMTQLLIPVAYAPITRAATAQTHTEHDAKHTMQITAASWARSPLVSNCTSIQTEFWRPCFLDSSMPRCYFSVLLCDQDYTNSGSAPRRGSGRRHQEHASRPTSAGCALCVLVMPMEQTVERVVVCRGRLSARLRARQWRWELRGGDWRCWNKREGTTRSESDVSHARYSWAAYIGRGGEQKGRRWSLTAPLQPLMEIMSLKAQRGEDRD
jgi:hypothetical protein